MSILQQNGPIFDVNVSLKNNNNADSLRILLSELNNPTPTASDIHHDNPHQHMKYVPST